MEKNYLAPSAALFAAHERFKESKLSKPRLKHHQLVDLLTDHSLGGRLEVATVGRSTENRSIARVVFGQGPIRVMLWSQMHGDEPTATMALFDIFNFLAAEDQQFAALRQQLASQLTLWFIPALNPDGAERFTRENAQGIDINRDAQRLQTLEGQLLEKIRKDFDPQYAFNLHDQNPRHHLDGKAAHMTFSAPAYNDNKSLNKSRTAAAQLCAHLFEKLAPWAKGHVGRYDDSHCHRCFGDHFQREGASTILIESGHKYADPDKRHIRRLNFVAILEALAAIASGEHEKQDYKAYREMPENTDGLHDLIIRNARVELAGRPCLADLAIDIESQKEELADGFEYRGTYVKIGDLSGQHAYRELDAEGLDFVLGKTFPSAIEQIDELNEANVLTLLDMGYTNLRVKAFPKGKNTSLLPLTLVDAQLHRPCRLALGEQANFTLQKNGKAQWAVVNGFVLQIAGNDFVDFTKNKLNLKHL